MSLLKNLEKGPDEYSFKKWQFASSNISQGKHQAFFQGPTLGRVVSKMLVFVQKAENTIGKLTKNSFLIPQFFDNNNFNIESVQLLLNNDPIDCTVIDKNDFGLVYRQLFRNLNQQNYGCAHISYGDFIDNTLLFLFDTTSSAGSTPGWVQPICKEGSYRICVNFSKQTTHDLTLTVMSEIPSNLKIKKDGSVLTDAE